MSREFIVTLPAPLLDLKLFVSALICYLIVIIDSGSEDPGVNTVFVVA